MDHDILISVIIPAYNAVKYLDRAVQSVLCQMDGCIELILVDDGSADGTGAMCDAYAEKYPNVRVIHKQNGGTSSAKNRGIAAAKGQYLSFMDSDDYLDPAAYARISAVLRQHQPDCLDFGWNYIDSQENIRSNHHEVEKDILLHREIIDNVILPPLLNLRDDKAHFVYDFACNKVFKAEIIRSFSVRFDEDKRTWEDRTFLLRHLKHCHSYYSMGCCLYNYVWMPNSLSQRYALDIFNIILANFNHYRELYSDKFEFDTEYANNYWCHAIENMIYRSLDQTENREQIRINILDTLANDIVVGWYTNRTAADAFESKVSGLVKQGRVETALRCYVRQSEKRKLKAFCAQTVAGVKNRIRKVLGN